MNINKKIGLFPGTFDPITNGHLDLIARGLVVVDHLIIAVAENVGKNQLLTVDERVQLIEDSVKSLDGIEVRVAPKKLTVDFAKEVGASVILRGLRSATDFEYEKPNALMGKLVEPDVETVFLLSNPEYMPVSSSIIKEMVKFGGDVSKWVPSCVSEMLAKKFDGE